MGKLGLLGIPFPEEYGGFGRRHDFRMPLP
ncbi:acyl-CoA dehydrogenase family protein [Peribacillus frigoritolerans]|nr:acyl-CoA dehydrogenase family protein [Peribacillus frigoritolerans]